MFSIKSTYLSIRVNHNDILQPNVLIAIWQLRKQDSRFNFSASRLSLSR